MAPKKIVSSVRVSEASEKAIDKLNAKEFRERFLIPHDVLIDLVNEEAAMPTEKGGKKRYPLHKGTIQRGAPVPSAGVVQGIPPLLSNSPHLYSPQPCPGADGCSIINMLVSAHLPSLQMVTELPDSTKGGRRAGGSLGWMGGAIAASVEAFFSELYPKNSGFGIEGPPCGLGGKGILCLSSGEPQEYVINILPRKLAKDEIVPGEHYTVKELPLYQEAKEADAERRRKLLEDRDQKKTEGTIRKAPGQKRGPDSPPKKTSGKRGKLVKKHGKDAKEPLLPRSFLLHKLPMRGSNDRGASKCCSAFYLKRPRRMSGLNHSGPSLVAAARLANVAEEAASINHPGNLIRMQLKRPRWRKRGQKAKSGLFERLQERRQQEIEISCASAHDAHPDGGEVEMATETSAVPAIIPAEDASGPMCPDENMGAPIPGHELPSPSSSEEESADDAAPASPFSYAELEAKLKQITPDWKAIKPSAKMFDMIETGPPQHVSTTRSFYSAAADADYMRTFSSRHQEIENQLRLRMEEAEASLSTMREENEALRVELAEAKGQEESTAGRLHEAEGEAARLRDELSRLRTEVLNEKKQKEDLQLRLDVQKEELEREFAVEREELAADYQRQVDDTFIFGYRCCMKKNGIKRDTPSIPPSEEKKLHEKPAP
ncbi:hypothetical protein CK203_104039 [Vitis vinifera]|uniref:Uncharacterized protein n=1 Tax=Vitis vinifera TaxID=29760 RepID=A0A438CG89_VITVI|nr:hypothetical protein CK203_104039 [Vitis vinifera]